jgi:hypothetical protein
MQATLDTYTAWLEQHRAGLTNLTHCSVVGDSGEGAGAALHLHSLPGAQLGQLHMKGLGLQLEHAGGCSGVLGDCSSLTALDLRDCIIEDVPPAAEAIAALTQLQDLRLINVKGAR